MQLIKERPLQDYCVYLYAFVCFVVSNIVYHRKIILQKNYDDEKICRQFEQFISTVSRTRACRAVIFVI